MDWVVVLLLLAIIGVLGALLWAQRNEIRYLRDQLAEKRDHEIRVERTQVGLPELRTEVPKDVGPPPEVAAEIEELLGEWDHPATQQQLREDVWALKRDGHGWPYILNWLREEILGGE